MHFNFKKGTILALSSTEAEYIAMYEASKLIMWLRQFLTELGYPPPTPTTLFEDNKSAIQIVHNNNDRGRTKHMDVRCHLIRELVKNNITVWFGTKPAFYRNTVRYYVYLS